mgnify:CR=1 FL=1
MNSAKLAHSTHNDSSRRRWKSAQASKWPRLWITCTVKPTYIIEMSNQRMSLFSRWITPKAQFKSSFATLEFRNNLILSKPNRVVNFLYHHQVFLNRNLWILMSSNKPRLWARFHGWLQNFWSTRSSVKSQTSSPLVSSSTKFSAVIWTQTQILMVICKEYRLCFRWQTTTYGQRSRERLKQLSTQKSLSWWKPAGASILMTDRRLSSWYSAWNTLARHQGRQDSDHTSAYPDILAISNLSSSSNIIYTSLCSSSRMATS